MKSFDHFSVIAPYYDRFIRQDDPERFREIYGLPVSGRMLDAGGGTGKKSQSLISYVSKIVIADSSMGMLTEVKKKNGLVPVCSETEHLPFADEVFERIIMVDAFHHVADHLKTVSEFWRVLQPEGCIIIVEPDIRTSAVK